MADFVQRSFTGGEIAPALRSRADMSKYTTGLALCENNIIRPQGGVYSRPGTRFLCELDDMSARGRLIPFQFNTEQTYVLIFEDQKIRILKDGGLVESLGSPVEVITPYTTDELFELQFTQSADVMTIVHQNHPPYELSRTSDVAWTLDLVTFFPTINTPSFSTFTTWSITNATNTDPCTITTTVPHSLVTGNWVTFAGVGGMTELNDNYYQIIVTGASSFVLIGIDATTYGTYTSGGSVVRTELAPVGSGFGSYEKTYTYVVTAVGEDGVESLPSLPASITNASLSTTAGIYLEFSSITGADYYRVYKDPSDGTGIYGWIGDTNVNNFTDFNVAPVTSDSPPSDRQPFMTSQTWPATVAYYQQRLILANTRDEPQTVFTSQTGIYNSFRFSTPARADDAITFTVNSKQVNEIRHAIEMDSLVLLTSGGEFRVTEGQDQVLTPSTVGVRKQSNNGASWVTPVVVDDTIIFVQEKGGRVRDINYEFVDDRYKGNDLSIMSEHLFSNYELTEMTYSAEPYGIVWCVRDDGRMLGLTYQREHQVWAWHQHVTSTSAGESSFESVTTIAEDGRDAVYTIVKRTIDGVTKRYVERMEPRYVTGPEDVWCVDSGLQYEGSPATVISGLDHLEGEPVAVVSDGNVVNGLTVAGGAITLPRAASKVTVGLPYQPVIETLDIDQATMSETIKANRLSVSEVNIEVENSRGLWVGPKGDDGSTGQMVEVKPRNVSAGYSAIPLYTGKEEVRISPQWSKGGGIRIEQRDPMPLAILSIIPTINVS